jgi:hypothetical protein
MEMAVFFCCGAVETKNLVWIGSVLAVLVVGAMAGYLLVKRFAVTSLRGKEGDSSFTLEQIIQLHREGQLSDEEFKVLNVKIIQNNRFTLEQIRKLHQEGQLSDEEFQTLKEKIIQKARFG